MEWSRSKNLPLRFTPKCTQDQRPSFLFYLFLGYFQIVLAVRAVYSLSISFQLKYSLKVNLEDRSGEGPSASPGSYKPTIITEPVWFRNNHYLSFIEGCKLNQMKKRLFSVAIVQKA